MEIKPNVKYPDHTEEAIFVLLWRAPHPGARNRTVGISPVENWAEYHPALCQGSSSLIIQAPRNL
jgi:hypothetical protein